jgi:hypothetical protein
MSAKAARHSFRERDQGFMPTEALSAQRLLGEEGKKREGGEEERRGGRAPVSEQASPESQEPSVASIKR